MRRFNFNTEDYDLMSNVKTEEFWAISKTDGLQLRQTCLDLKIELKDFDVSEMVEAQKFFETSANLFNLTEHKQSIKVNELIFESYAHI